MARRLALCVVLLLVAALPQVVTDPYFRNTLILCGIYALFAVALDMLVGFLGIDSFGHAAFFGAGAYATAILMRQFGVSYWAAVPAAMAFTGLLGWVISIPALRMRGVHFAITTLACAEIVRLVAINWPSMTRGVMGMNVDMPAMPWVEPGNENIVFYYVVFAALGITCFLLARFVDSAPGRALVAIRENEQLATVVGIPAFKIKSAVFTVSAIVTGLAGALYAPFVGIISPDILSVNYSALALLMVVVGGKGTIFGAIFGAVMFTVVTEFFRIANDLRMIVFSLLLVVSILLMPRGIVVPVFRLAQRLLSRQEAASSIPGERPTK